MELPEGWELRESKNYPGRVFYYNAKRNESTWIRPAPYPGSSGPQPIMINISHILIKHRDSAIIRTWRNPTHVSRSRNQAFRKAQAIFDSITKKSITFEEAARIESDCFTHAEDGYIGWISKGVLHRYFDRYGWELKIGEVSLPFETSEGYHIIRRNA